MAAQGTRTLKLSILADVDNLNKSLTAGQKDVETFGEKVGAWSTKIGLAFGAAAAAAGAYALKLTTEGIKAAVDDEAAQDKLAKTLENVTKATDAQVLSVESYITKTALAKGVTDDELRPSLERLARATGDLGKAQELQTLALDVAAGSGKSLETVSNALGKAYEGNTASLAKLGLGLSSAELKTMTFDQVTQALNATFKDQANVQADTFAGRMERIKIAFDEAKESLGVQLLPVITTFVDYLIKTAIPAVQSWVDENGPKLVTVLKDQVIPTITSVVTTLGKIVTWIADNSEAIKAIGAILLTGLAAAKITTAVTGIVTTLGTLSAAYAATAAAATAAGTATTTAATGAAVAAGASGGWAALASRLNVVVGVVGGLVAAFAVLAQNEKVIAKVEGATKTLPGLGTFGIGGGSGATGGTGAKIPVTVTPSTSFERMGLGAAQASQAAAAKVTVPTMPSPEELARQQQIATAQAAAAAAAKAQAEEMKQTKKELADAASTLSNLNTSLAVTAASIAGVKTIDDRRQAIEANRAIINFNGPVVSDPESLARLVANELNNSSVRTGNYPVLGIAPTSLTQAAI